MFTRQSTLGYSEGIPPIVCGYGHDARTATSPMEQIYISLFDIKVSISTAHKTRQKRNTQV